MRCAFRAVEVQPQEVHDGVRERPSHVLRAQGHKSACSQINGRRSGLPTHPDSPLHAHPSSGQNRAGTRKARAGLLQGFSYFGSDRYLLRHTAGPADGRDLVHAVFEQQARCQMGVSA